MLEGINILIVEDNSLNQKIANFILQKQGANITFAGNGKESIELIGRQDFDIVLMDIQMPVMDGYEATRYIRNVLKSEVPIVACTASSFEDETRECLEAGMNECICKPFESHVLCELILKLTKEREKNNSFI